MTHTEHLAQGLTHRGLFVVSVTTDLCMEKIHNASPVRARGTCIVLGKREGLSACCDVDGRDFMEGLGLGPPCCTTPGATFTLSSL